MTHWLLHRACVCLCRKQIIQLLCKITSTHPRDSPARHQTGFTSVSKYISITILISADYLFLPSPPSLNDGNKAAFCSRKQSRAGGCSCSLELSLPEAFHLQMEQKCRVAKTASPSNDQALCLWWRFPFTAKIFLALLRSVPLISISELT